MNKKISVVIPYYNERANIRATLESMGRQTSRDFCLILVDNASDDGSADIAREIMAGFPDLETHFLHNPRPGQLPTLDFGLAAVRTPYVATCDADTVYPAHYIAQCIEMFEKISRPKDGPVVGVMAVDLYQSPGSSENDRRIRKIINKSRVFTSQCHAGGYAQAYRTDIVRKVGGFGTDRWPYLLYDHELYEQVRRHGQIRYSPNHYCFSSDRRTDRSAVSWTWLERTVYRFTPGAGKQWFFYQFLARRFARRGLFQEKLRQRDF